MQDDGMNDRTAGNNRGEKLEFLETDDPLTGSVFGPLSRIYKRRSSLR